MSNILRNGTVLPSGLLGPNLRSTNGAFKKTYRNVSLRIGIVLKYYAINDPDNLSQKYPEYDVLALEQDEDRGSFPGRYYHCRLSSSFGSIADFFEYNLRPLTAKTTKGEIPTFSGQDGAIVLLLCLNGMSETAIILSSMSHPDRETELVDNQPRLVGEYNGVKIMVNPDGSTSLTFQGATDNNGDVIDSSQGTTTFQVKTDGSFEFNHDAIDILADRQGKLSITTKTDCSIQATGNLQVDCQDATVTAKGTATVEGKDVKLGVNAAEAVVLGDTFKKYFDTHIVETALGPSGPPINPMPPNSLSKKVKTE